MEGALTKAGIAERKAMIDRSPCICRLPAQAKVVEHQPGQRLLHAAAGVAQQILSRHAADRRIASRVSVRGQPACCAIFWAATVLRLAAFMSRTLMKRMGIEAYLSPSRIRVETGARAQNLPVSGCGGCRPSGQTRSGAMDITYIPMARGFRLSRRRRRLVQPACAFSPSGVDHHGSRLLRRGSRRSHRPTWQTRRSFNTDQGGPVHQHGLHRCSLEKHGIAISMDGKGSWRDNVFVERLWRSVKYEEVLSHGPTTPSGGGSRFA